ncbi:uncharacterized protein LOC121807552 isoform X1 [Salvia splendens]|uniref:uncharacterized protein LOC121807552 isoform X1 n=1 Tax=Salvia splendens TaxID=180675 RepID=UPI001C26B8FB|nr:uncharacterized protein LOC121807552 isoform X1 [Salvia splendens]
MLIRLIHAYMSLEPNIGLRMAKVQRRRLEDDYTGDRISMLPDDILVLILSSLTLKEAARTSTLCSRWSERIDDWLSYAVSRKVESIELTWKANLPRNCYPFPYKQGNFPDNLKLLKKLSFSYVNVSCEAVAFLLGYCRLLEQLSLCGIPLSSLVVIRTSLVFKCLEISRCSALNSVVVRESKVVCIKYNGAGKPHCRFELVDVPLLTELWIQANAHQQYISALADILSMFDSVLPQLHTLKIYAMSNYTRRNTWSDVKIMPNLKELGVVLGSDYRDNHPLLPIIHWFSVAPCLQRFVIEASHQEMTQVDKKELIYAPKWYSQYCLCKGRRDYSPIKEVVFVGYRGVCNHFEMIERLVTYSLALEKIIVDPRSFLLCKNIRWDYISRNQICKESSK